MSDAHGEGSADAVKAMEGEPADDGGGAVPSAEVPGPSLDDDERATLPMEAPGRVVVTGQRARPAVSAGAGAITVQVVGRTDVGLVREHNEDNYLLADLGTGGREPSKFTEVPPAGLLFAVCDGMGGAAAGEIASQMAVDTIYEMMRRSVPAPDRDGVARALVGSVEEAGSRIFESARADRTRRGMGTTATVAALIDKILFVGQVGDSRAYVLRNTELKQVTKDQSLVNQLIEAGQLTEAEAEAFEHSNIILQALGTTEQVTVDLTFLELRQGDRLMMCSDGLSGLVHGDVMRDVLVEYRDLDACCDRLIELAKAGGGHDNVTVILCDFGGAGLRAATATDLVGYQQYPLPLSEDGGKGTGGDSDNPTLAPPSERARVGNGVDDFGEFPGATAPTSGTGARFVVLGLLALLLAFVVFLWLGGMQRSSALPSELPRTAVAPIASGSQPVARVEVVVRTDIENGELMVDGESFGTGTQGRWVLDLSPGPHRLDARAGGSTVTTTLVTVRVGVPATVLLSMPEGALAATDDAGPVPTRAENAQGASFNARRGAAHAGDGDGGAERQRRSTRRKRRTEVETRVKPPVPTPTPPASPTPTPAPIAPKAKAETGRVGPAAVPPRP